MSSPARPDAASILDPEQLEMLRKESPGLLERLSLLFRSVSVQTIAGMEAALAAGNDAAVAAGAHALKGSAMNFGATRLVATCESLEQAGRKGAQGEHEGLHKLLDALRVEYQFVAEILAESDQA